MFWSRTDQPPGITFGGGIPIPNQRDQARFSSSLTKLLATGATAGIAFNSNYLFRPPFQSVLTHPGPAGIFGTADDPPPTVFTRGVPAQYTPNIELTLRQPLLRGAGTDFNRALIVIARLQSDQSLWDLKEAMLGLVRSVAEAFWNLQAAHGSLRAIEEVIPQVQELVRIREEEYRFETKSLDLLAEARTRLADFRQERVVAMANVLQRETALRYLLGFPPADGRRLVPLDKPSLVPVTLDWQSTLAETMEHRPKVVRQRLAVRVRELQVLRADNAMQPQLDLEGLWRIHGLDKELDEAIGLLTDNQFTDWQVGFSMSVPLGFRQAAAELQAIKLVLATEWAGLREEVHLIAHELNAKVRRLDSLYEQYLVADERVRHSRQWVDIARTRATPELAEGDLAEKQNIYFQALDAQRRAVIAVSNLVAEFNTELASLEETKGTLLATWGIELAEDPCVRVRFGHGRLPIVEPHTPHGERN